jgi:catechol 2,3-dioxygenase-like lactoylglutathione lyase family enzyme
MARTREELMRMLVIGTLAFCLASPALAETPAVYGEVTSLNWVVRDIDQVKAGWTKLGYPAVQDFGEVAFPVRYQGEPHTAVMRVAQAIFDGLSVFWLQPVSGKSAWADFLEEHGEGVMSVNYAAASGAALDAEVARLEGLGIAVLQTMSVDGGQGPLRVVHMDTAGGGKYVLGLTHGSVAPPPGPLPPAPFGAKLSQHAVVVKDLKAVSAYWETLGLPVMDVTHPTLTDLQYRGQPGQFDQKLGWHRHGTITWEWIEPLAGPTVYQDFLDAHGEGYHHLGFDVSDIDEVGEAWTALGHPIVQSGGWGEKGKPDSGRFAYADTTGIGGLTIELLWNHPGDD